MPPTILTNQRTHKFNDKTQKYAQVDDRHKKYAAARVPGDNYRKGRWISPQPEQCRCQQGRRCEHLAESVPKTVTFGIGTFSVVQQSRLEKRPRGG